MFWEDYLWILVTGSLLAFFTSWGIGANDVANSFATSVGSKSVTLPMAILIAGTCNFLGAVLLGSDVTNTISHGLVDVKLFQQQPEMLMYGMLCVIASTGLWLWLACYLELPVSTTHSTIGGVIGFSLVTNGFDAIVWYSFDDSKEFLHKFGGIVPIVASWIISPVLSGLIAALLFLIVRTFVLRATNSFERSLTFFPLFVGLTVVVNMYYICLVGFHKRKVDYQGKNVAISDILGYIWSSVIAWGVAIIVVLVLWFQLVPWLRKKAAERSFEAGEGNTDEPSDPLLRPEEGQRPNSWLETASKIFDADIADSIGVDPRVTEVHEKSEKFDPTTEISFSYLQVFTAACVAFAHGANDVANSIGPLAAIFSIYKHSVVAAHSTVPIWILVLGGAGIVLGLATYGHTIIRVIGIKLVKVSPGRGFAMEFATAAVITFGSIYGIPLSTTHCQVGSTTGVGLLEGKKGINGWLLLKVIGGWILTIIIVALTAAAFFAQGIYAPSRYNLDSIRTYETGINDALMDVAQRALSTDMQDEVREQTEAFVDNKQDNSAEQIDYLQRILGNVTGDQS